LEASLELTRACLEVCAEYRNPVGIITKGVLVLRDLDVLRRLHQEASVRVYFSIPFSDDEVARKVEPHAPSSRKRFEAMATLAEAGIPTGISLSPIIPGLNDEDVPDLLARAKQAGAMEAMATLLRLSGPVEPVFMERMAAAFPDRITKIIHRIRDVRGGAISEGAFFERHHGAGPYWAIIEQMKLVDAARGRVKECTVVQAKAKLDRGEVMHFLDVREDHEFAKDHAKGARHLGKGIIERDVETSIPNKEEAILLYCGGGYRSALAADALQHMGYTNVVSMDGGIKAWRDAGYPMER
jgi:rhodanese-related sulfurtransferase